MTYSALIEFQDGREQSVFGYSESHCREGVVQFVWPGEVLTFPLFGIKSICERLEDDSEA